MQTSSSGKRPPRTSSSKLMDMAGYRKDERRGRSRSGSGDRSKRPRSRDGFCSTKCFLKFI